MSGPRRSDCARPWGMTPPPPKKKKDQLALAQYGDKLPANRPDPDDPGGLGAEESGTERTGPTQDSLFAVQEGGRWAEVGRYYDSANDPVTAWTGNSTPEFLAGSGAGGPSVACE